MTEGITPADPQTVPPADVPSLSVPSPGVPSPGVPSPGPLPGVPSPGPLPGPGPAVPSPGPAGPSPVPDVPVPLPERPSAPVPLPPEPSPLSPTEPATPAEPTPGEPTPPVPAAPDPTAPDPTEPDPTTPDPTAPVEPAGPAEPSDPVLPTDVAVAPAPTDAAPVVDDIAAAPAAEAAPEAPAAEAPAVEAPAAEESAAEAPAPEATAAEAPAAEESAAAPATTDDPPAEPAAPAEAPTAPTAPAAPVAPPAGGPKPATPRPIPSPGHRPGNAGRRPKPAGAQAKQAGGPAAVAPVVEPVEPVDPHLWGRIDENGVVYVRTAAGEREIGNWQAGDAEAGLAHFGRRFDDFATEISLLETRLASGSGDPKATKAQATALRDSVDTLAVIGDLDSAAARLEDVIAAADHASTFQAQARAAARQQAVATKEALCVEAEELAQSTQWKQAGDRLKEIVEEWRAIRGIDRKTDDALWKRFAKARDTFTRHRGSHFAELDKQRLAAKEHKEKLIKRAEELAESSDWGETATAYRTLMTEWKAAGRAPRDVEDALWDRFRAAQETFFSRRNRTFAERDAEFDANAVAKEKLLVEAEAINPSDVDGARAALRSIQERWEAAGKVPRERMRELDGRLRAVEDKVRHAEQQHWKRTDPETTARLEQFRVRVEQYRAQEAKARAAGNTRKAAEAQAQAAQWEQYLAAAERAVDS